MTSSSDFVNILKRFMGDYSSKIWLLEILAASPYPFRYTSQAGKVSWPLLNIYILSTVLTEKKKNW
jgi:hypothetical protein